MINSIPEDMLHLRGRVGHKVMVNLIMASTDHTGNKFVPGLVAMIKTIGGVPFKISETQVRGRAQVGYNALTGRHWRILLQRLPQLIRSSSAVFAESHKEPLASLIQNLASLLSFAGKCNKSDAEEVAKSARLCTKQFLDLSNLGLRGFSNTNVTPYIHWLNIHVPYSISLFGGLDKLSGELLERQNDEVKKSHGRRTHCKDPKQTLKVEKRRERQLMDKQLEDKTRKTRNRKEGPIHPW